MAATEADGPGTTMKALLLGVSDPAGLRYVGRVGQVSPKPNAKP